MLSNVVALRGLIIAILLSSTTLYAQYKYTAKSAFYGGWIVPHSKNLDAIAKGGNMPCILNAANEVVNEGFRTEQCSFPDIGRIIQQTMATVSYDANPSLDVYLQTDTEARRVAHELMNGR